MSTLQVTLATAAHRPWQASTKEPAVRLSHVVAALSQALDLSTGQPLGHSIRACLIGMRIAEEIGAPEQIRNDLFYALLLKDCGCSSNASKTFHTLQSDDIKAKGNVKTTDWTSTNLESIRYALAHVATGKPMIQRTRAILQLAIKQKSHAKEVTHLRCERGATLARLMGLSENTATAVRNLDEHWDGSGLPEGFIRTEIPLLSRIMLLAQTLEVFLTAQGENAALEISTRRKGKWFDPDLVKAVHSLHRRDALWADIFREGMLENCLATEPHQRVLSSDHTSLDRICNAFSQIVDAKSPFTYNHSLGVANAAVATARMLGLPRERVLFIRHAALLHDLGKLSVPNTILEKNGKLDDAEWQIMRRHAFYTHKVLSGIPGFEDLCEVAASHHEKLDGSGYFRGLDGSRLPLESRILAVADVFDALAATRPYREALPREKVFEILWKDAPRALDANCVKALEQSGTESNQSFIDLENLNQQLSSFSSFKTIC